MSFFFFLCFEFYPELVLLYFLYPLFIVPASRLVTLVTRCLISKTLSCPYSPKLAHKFKSFKLNIKLNMKFAILFFIINLWELNYK